MLDLLLDYGTYGLVVFGLAVVFGGISFAAGYAVFSLWPERKDRP